MKLKNSILFPIIYVFLLIFLAVSVFIVEKTYRLNYEKEVRRLSKTHYDSLLQILFYMEISDSNQLNNLFDNWEIRDLDQGLWFVLVEDRSRTPVVNISDYSLNIETIVNSNIGKRLGYNGVNHQQYVNDVDIDNRKFLGISEYIRIPNLGTSPYRFYIIKDITDLIEEKESLYYLFLIIGLIASILFIVIISFILCDITKPVKYLADATTSFKSGELKPLPEDKFNVKELHTLCQNFNNMMYIINKQMNVLKEENQKKEFFINSLTHELNTPLTSIIGHSELILSALLNENKKTESLLFISSEGRRMKSIIDQLFKMIVDREFNSEVVNSDILLNNIVFVWEKKAVESNVKIKKTGKGFNIIGNSELLNVAIGNFLYNGIKASPRAGTVNIRQNREERSISIIDSGDGICSENIENIKKPFYRGIKSDSVRGLGLGVSIADEILNRHGYDFKIIQNMNSGLEIKILFKDGSLCKR